MAYTSLLFNNKLKLHFSLPWTGFLQTALLIGKHSSFFKSVAI